ncbi:uncharacterized protein LOC112007428 [Quercus suber]|uniref:uncharacterized protein LOC112007428 n=1 Tax=Quercus suber TaxID=58331 RepID=UPI000CE22DEE|nr:uncharacterized protein LOC112007428 [Quercus suber]
MNFANYNDPEDPMNYLHFSNGVDLTHLDVSDFFKDDNLIVQRIIHLQGIANQLPDVFTDNKKIVKSHIPAANTPARIEVPVGQSVNTLANESKPHLKRGRPIGVKDKILRKIPEGYKMPETYNPISRSYLSDPHKDRSQAGYLFTYGNPAISWRSVKQTIFATSSNHVEITAIHEASRECIWLRSKSGDIDVKQIRSCDNLADMFTKPLPTANFKKMVHNIGMRRLKDIRYTHEGE